MLKRKRLVIITALILSLCMAVDTGAVWAKSLSELQKEISKKQEQLEKGEKEEANLSAQLNDLEKTIYELNGQIAVSEKKLVKLKKELKKAEAKVKEQNQELGGRLRNMYKNGSVGFVDVLLNSHSFSEFLTNLDLVEKIYASDKEVLEELQAAHQAIKEKKQKVEKLKKDLEVSRATAKTEMEAVSKKKAEIAADNEKNDKMLAELEQEAAALEAQLSQQSESGEISNSETSDYTGGELAWPTPGFTYITSPYGWRICPFHGREFHGGIDIGADNGSNIIASASGTVISSGWNGGFGYSVQVDHGGGLVTMYNHCSSLLVSSGTKVKKGQVIAKVGTTGSSTGPHLDYRVFKNGSTVNPMGYF